MADNTNPAEFALEIAERETAAQVAEWETAIVSGPPVPTDPDWVVERKQAYADQVAALDGADADRQRLDAEVELGHSITEDVERDLAQRAAEAGVDLTRPVGNADDSDRPHFAVNVGSVETCGQCVKPWPCDTWTNVIAPRLEASGAGVVLATDRLAEQQAAEAAAILGLDAEGLAQFREWQKSVS